MQPNCRLSKSVWILGLVLLTGPLFSRSSATWSGSAQCQLTLQTNGYTHQEVQTWTITEGQPTQQGAMHVYPATWRASGGGSSQKAQGLQILAMQWNSTVPETSAPIAVSIRASDNRPRYQALARAVTLDRRRHRAATNQFRRTFARSISSGIGRVRVGLSHY